MLGIFNKTDSYELDRLNEIIDNLENELKKKNRTIFELEEKLEDDRKKIFEYEDKIRGLRWRLEEEKENSLNLKKNNFSKQYFELLELFGFENKNLKKSLINIQESIAGSTNKAKESINLSDKVDLYFEKAFSDINKIVDNLDSLLKRSHSVATVIDELAVKAVNIEKFVGQINEVVMQINILSLNASVEAASAGEAGKGFAVVASEVKNLANKTSSVASDIEKVVKTIQYSIENTNSEFQEIDNDITTIHTSTREYNNEMSALHTLIKETLKELNNLSDNVFMNLAKIDHVIWKVDTYTSVYAKEPTFDFVDHKNCRLGQWYLKGDGIKYFSNSKSYHKLYKPHESIHNTTYKIFDLLKDDNNINYQRIKDTFLYMEDSSANVFKILDDILSDTTK